MSKIPEAVILDAQKRVYVIKDTEIPEATEKRRKAEKALEEAISDENYAKQRLREFVQFLQEHNSDSMREGETYWDELGITPQYGLERICCNCKKCISKSTDWMENDCPVLNEFRSAIGKMLKEYSSIQSGETYDYHFKNCLNKLASVIAKMCGGFETEEPTGLETEELSCVSCAEASCNGGICRGCVVCQNWRGMQSNTT